MPPRRRAFLTTAALAATAIPMAIIAGTQGASAVTDPSLGPLAYALSGTSLLSFNPQTPGTVTTTALTGVTTGETLVGIDLDPKDGKLYSLGIMTTTDAQRGRPGTVYVLQPSTGVATVVGTPGSVSFTSDGTTELDDLPDPTTSGYGFDIDPVTDEIRVTAGSENFRVNPTTGAPVDANTTDNTDRPQPDGSIHGGTSNVTGSAYTNSTAGSTVTTLYSLDGGSNGLYVQNPPNSGTQTLGKTVTSGGATLDFGPIDGFDIPSGVNAPSSNAPVTAGNGYAALTVAGSTSLYAINLVNAQASSLGKIGDGSQTIRGLALTPPPAATPSPSPSSSTASQAPVASPAKVADTTRPVLTGLRVSTRSKRQVIVTVTVSEPGTYVLKLVRERNGRLKSKTCVVGRSVGKKCVARSTYGTITITATRAGKLTFTAKGSIKGKKLVVGGGRAEVSGRDTAGNIAKTVTKGFTVKR